MMFRRPILARLLITLAGSQLVAGFTPINVMLNRLHPSSLHDMTRKNINSPHSATIGCWATPSSTDQNQDNAKEEDDNLTPKQVAELIEVSFVNGVLQLAQGYVDVLKLFIAAVQSGYALEIPPGTLLQLIAECPHQSANRPLMNEEVKLRTTWTQVVYLVLDYVKYKGKLLSDFDVEDVEGDSMDDDIQETYQGAIPIIAEKKKNGEAFEAEKMLQQCASVLPHFSVNGDELEKAILSQSLRVIWLTLTVLDEEEQCIEDKKPLKPQPPIPGAFD